MSAALHARREVLIRELRERYGVTLYPHPRRPDVAVLSSSDLHLLRAAVMDDRSLSAVGRGYYLGFGGELDLVAAPDWTCDPLSVALARLYASTLYRVASPALRALTALTRPQHP